MVSLGMLLVPILAATILVFIGSFIIHTVLPHHHTDFARLPDEDRMADAVRDQNISSGQYYFPFASTPTEMKDPAYIEKMEKGPIGLLVLWPPGAGFDLKQLVLHFLYLLVLSVFTAYLTGVAVPAGAEYLHVFRIAGTAAFLGYVGALFPYSIWFHFSWSSTWKSCFDGLVYALLTAGTFGWLWPVGQ